MSELKFACPVCGQHIKCDSIKSGTEMECPTCFRKMVVPQASTSGDTKFVLKAAAVQSRVVPGTLPAESSTIKPTSDRTTTMVVVALIVLGCAAGGAVFAFREKIFKPAEKPVAIKTNTSGPHGVKPTVVFTPAAASSETNWNLNLSEPAIPESPAAGRVNGRAFTLEKATVQGGTLTFRQQAKTPYEMSVTVNLFAKRGADLAGQSVNVESTWTNAPKVTLRWKNEQDQPVTKTYRRGYAMKIQFGSVTGGQLPGRIYLCVPDHHKSYVAGTFEAEIRKPSPPKPVRAISAAPTNAPKR